MDAETGEIYAAASLPLLDPNDRENIPAGATELKVVTHLFEPGSIFKSVSAMAILESGTMTPESELFCPSEIEADGYIISDAHDRGDATFTLEQIMDQSSNVGISLATENATANGVSGFENLYNKINEYNLHTRTGVDYPGEGEEGTEYLGSLLPFDKWGKVQAYNISFEMCIRDSSSTCLLSIARTRGSDTPSRVAASFVLSIAASLPKRIASCSPLIISSTI